MSGADRPDELAIAQRLTSVCLRSMVFCPPEKVPDVRTELSVCPHRMKKDQKVALQAFTV